MSTNMAIHGAAQGILGLPTLPVNFSLDIPLPGRGPSPGPGPGPGLVLHQKSLEDFSQPWLSVVSERRT